MKMLAARNYICVKAMDITPFVSGIGVSIKYITSLNPIFFLKDLKILKFFTPFYYGVRSLNIISFRLTKVKR
jgi:hypothetical protein